VDFRAFRLLLIGLLLGANPALGAECDPTIAEGAEAFRKAEQRSLESEWDRLSYSIENFQNKGNERVPIRLGQRVLLSDGRTGEIVRIDTSHDLAVLENPAQKNERYFTVPLQAVHPYQHGAKAIVPGGAVWILQDKVPIRGRVTKVSEAEGRATVVDYKKRIFDVSLIDLAADISGATRVFSSAHTETLTGDNSILNVFGIENFLNHDAFETLEGIQNLKRMLKLYGIETRIEKALLEGKFELVLDLKKSDPQNYLVQFVARANARRIKAGVVDAEVRFTQLEEEKTYRIIEKSSGLLKEAVVLKGNESFVPPKYFNSEQHTLEVSTSRTHASFLSGHDVVALSHKNVMYILLEGHLGRSVYHEFGHANSAIFWDSIDGIFLEWNTPFIVGYDLMSLDENRQHLRDLRRMLRRAINSRSVSGLSEVPKVIGSIARTSKLSEKLHGEIVDGGWHRLRKAKIDLTPRFPHISVAIGKNKSKIRIRALTQLMSTVYRNMIAGLPKKVRDLHNRFQNDLTFNAEQEMGLLSLADGEEERSKVLALLQERRRISQEVQEAATAIIVELYATYGPMAADAQQVLKNYAKLAKEIKSQKLSDEQILFIQEEISPGISNIWKRFTAHRNAQANLLKRQKEAQEKSRASPP
jgi:hypothetical protein